MEVRPRMGELLGRMVPLSGHDVEEILHEQGTSNRRFGEIALSWGLCQPEHVWSAWCLQVREELETVDLDRDGIDAQAVTLIPADTARTLRAIPVRRGENHVVIASAEPLGEHVRAELAKLVKAELKFVLAPRQQIEAALESYYTH